VLWPCPQRLAAAAAPALAWDGPLTPEGSFSYKWALTKTVSGGTASSDNTATTVRVQKGLTQQVTYKVIAARSVDQSTVKASVTGALTVTNVNAAAVNFTGVLTVRAVTLTIKSATGATSTAEAAVPATCSPALPAQLQPGGVVRCAFSKAPYGSYPDPGQITASVDFDDSNAAPPAAPPATSVSPTFTYDSVVGQFASAMLTDKVDSSSIDTLYKGFTGYTLDNVWRAVDPTAAVPAAGVLITTPRAEYTCAGGGGVEGWGGGTRVWEAAPGGVVGVGAELDRSQGRPALARRQRPTAAGAYAALNPMPRPSPPLPTAPAATPSASATLWCAPAPTASPSPTPRP
jgi:hypothetical protein